MKIINVSVRDKIASAVGDIVYICGNSDYVINFDFDAEWDDYDVKTARFVHDGTYTDVVFTGEQCAMPVIHKAYGIYVGVYAGDLRTTTPAHIPSAASILSAEGAPAAPPDDVYAQLMKLCNEAVSEATSVRDDADAGKFNGAPGKTPEAGVDYFTEADKQAIAAEAAQKVGFPKPTDDDIGTLHALFGQAKWEPFYIVSITENNGALSADKTFEEIYIAMVAGIQVYADYTDFLVPLIYYTADTMYFGSTFAFNDGSELSVKTLLIQITKNDEVYDLSAAIERLPNPNPLTIKLGNEIVSYDGSDAKTVDVVEAVGFPKPTTANDGKYLGCENGAPVWMPVEASGGGATEEIWELIDTIPLVKDTVVYDIASFDVYKKLAVAQDRAIISVASSGTNWIRLATKTGSNVKQVMIDGSILRSSISFWAMLQEGNALKFFNWNSMNASIFRLPNTNYYMVDNDLAECKMQIIISKENAANINTEANFLVYGVRR